MLPRLEHATLALSLSSIVFSISTPLVIIQHDVITIATGRVRSRGTDVSTSRAFAFVCSKGCIRYGRYPGDGRVNIAAAVGRQGRSRLQSEGRDGDNYSGTRKKYTPVADDVAMVSFQMNESDEEHDGRNQTDQIGPSSESRLKSIVTQLQGDLQAGKTPNEHSRKRVDGLFAELRATNRTSPISATTATSERLETPFPTHLDRAFTPGGQDLESLTDMLQRLQAIAKARDLEEDGQRAAALRSGGYGAGNIGWTSLNTYKHNELEKRFSSIRKGRVSWAVLPLVMRAREAGIPLSTGVYNAAIAAYTSTPKKYTDALKVLRLLKDSEDPGVRPDLKSYNIAMRVCGEAGKWRVVLELLAEMQSEGIAPDTASYNSALNGLAKRREWYRARRLFRQMVSSGLSPDGHSYNGLVEAAGMGSISPRQNMIQIVYDMEQAGVEPTPYTYTLLLHCLARRGKTFDGFQVMARLVDARAPLLPLGYRAGLLSCMEYGDWRRAMVLMEDMRVAKMRISGVMYLFAVQACAKGGQWERALSLMVERRTTAAREAVSKQAERKRGDNGAFFTAAGTTEEKAADGLAPAERHANELDMKILEAVLGTVSDAGQFEVAIRLVQQMRTAGKTPNKVCYLHALRAASKWGRWDVVESLMSEMRALGVGVVSLEPEDMGIFAEDAPSASMVLSSDCYPPLVEAYAQAAVWEKTIKAYREGFVLGRRGVKMVPYRVYESVLKACVATRDGLTALEVIQRQHAEPQELLKALPRPTFMVEQDEASGGPPDRRCWCLAAEALGRASMIKKGHGVLRAMVNSGIPVRESTKADVPSLMPLPTTADGFGWHQRRRRRRRRPVGNANISPLYLAFRREAVIRQLINSSAGVFPSKPGRVGVGSSKKCIAGVELAKGVINGEACAAAAVAAARGTGEGRKRGLRLGRLLVSDWTDKDLEMKLEARGDGLLALECKRRRMREFSFIRQSKEVTRDEPSICADPFESGSSFSVEGEGVPPLHLRPGGRRGRNEALTLRMRVRRTPGILGHGSISRSKRGLRRNARVSPSCRRTANVTRGVA